MLRTNRLGRVVAASLTAALVTTVALFGPVSAGVAAPAPNTGITFGIGPASASKIDGRSYLSFLASPGGRATDHIAIENFGQKALRINVYAVDTVTNSDGSIGFAPRAAVRKETGSWLAVGGAASRGSLVVAGRHATIVPIAIDVPHNAQPGDHAAGIVASVTSRVKSKNGTRPNLEQRVALRTYVRVSGTLGPALTVRNMTIDYGDNVNPLGAGHAQLAYDVVNTGNVRLAARQQVDVSGFVHDSSAVPSPPDVPVLLPGASAHYSVSIPDVWPQIRITAHVRLRPLPVTGDTDPKLPSVYQGSVSTWAVPWAFVALCVVVALVVVLAIRRVRRPSSARHGARRSAEAVGV